VSRVAINHLAESGQVNLVLHPIAITGFMDTDVDEGVALEISTRLASAIAWVAENDPEYLLAFHHLLIVWFDNWSSMSGTERSSIVPDPHDRNSRGIVAQSFLTDERVANMALQSGVSPSVADGIANGSAYDTFGQWVTSSTMEAIHSGRFNTIGRTGIAVFDARRWDTPTVFLDDVPVLIDDIRNMF